MREFVTGNQTIARAAVQSGCNFFAGYPITPASSILTEMVRAFTDGTAVAIQTEDEISAIGQCIGASMAGARALTATSGPGISLYSENIGFAQMIEAPLVIVDVQRMGPATGGATATADGDVLFARHVTSGSYPLPVLAATDAQSAYRLTCEAFRIAEALRTPVILLSSKEIGLTRQTVDLAAVPIPTVRPRTRPSGTDAFRPYAIEHSAGVPAFLPVGDGTRVRVTGSIHDERGLLTVDPVRIDRKLRHLYDKIESRAARLEFVELDADAGADTLLVSYGTCDGAARSAVRLLRGRGVRITHLTLFGLWPLPAAAIRAAAAGVRRIVIPELNVGLYAEELRRCVPVPVVPITRLDGHLIPPRVIAERVEVLTSRGAVDAPAGRAEVLQ